MSVEIAFGDPALAEIANDAAAELEPLLRERPAVRFQPPAPIQLDGGISLIVLAIAATVGSGVGSAAGADIWQSIKKIFQAGVRKVRRDQTEADGFELRVTWGDADQNSMTLRNIDVRTLESSDRLDGLTSSQLHVFETTIAPALRTLDASPHPPTSVRIKAGLGQEDPDRQTLWQVLLEVSARGVRGVPGIDFVAFAVGADGQLRWAAEPSPTVLKQSVEPGPTIENINEGLHAAPVGRLAKSDVETVAIDESETVSDAASPAATIVFRTNLIPDELSVYEALPPIERGEVVAIRWPEVNDELYARIASRRLNLRRELTERGVEPGMELLREVQYYDSVLELARSRREQASDRIASMWMASWATLARRARSGFVRRCKISSFSQI